MATAVQTKISSWGNSDAVRIPQSLLRVAGLSSGDSVRIVVNERNNIELVREASPHRRVKPLRGVTFESLFGGPFPDVSQRGGGSPWPDDGFVGSELEAWSH